MLLCDGNGDDDEDDRNDGDNNDDAYIKSFWGNNLPGEVRPWTRKDPAAAIAILCTSSNGRPALCRRDNINMVVLVKDVGQWSLVLIKYSRQAATSSSH